MSASAGTVLSESILIAIYPTKVLKQMTIVMNDRKRLRYPFHLHSFHSILTDLGQKYLEAKQELYLMMKWMTLLHQINQMTLVPGHHQPIRSAQESALCRQCAQLYLLIKRAMLDWWLEQPVE